MLTRLIKCGRIKVGAKLVTAGAELIHMSSGASGSERFNHDEDDHLFGETLNGLALRLSGNSTRPAPPNARLGFSSHPPMAYLPPVPLCSIFADGGLVSSICVLIQVDFFIKCCVYPHLSCIYNYHTVFSF